MAQNTRNNKNNRSNNRQSDYKKRTGAGYKSSDKNGNPCLYGWRATKQGLLKYLAVPTVNSEIQYHNQKGELFERWMVIVTRPDGSTFNASGLYYPSTQLVRIPELNIVIKPKAPNGGYCGTSVRKTYNN